MTALDDRPTTHLGNCVACNRPLRPKSISLEDAPGTVRHHGRGYCRTCHEKTPLPPLPRSGVTYAKCEQCGRRISHARALVGVCAICTGDRSPTRPAEDVIEDAEWLAQHGEVWDRAIPRLGFQSANGLERFLLRHKRGDLIRRLRMNGERG